MSKIVTTDFGGKLTPQQTFASALTAAESAQIAVVVLLEEDGTLCTAWSDGSLLKRLGMLDVAKMRMKDIAFSK